jgi:hypothetical protein
VTLLALLLSVWALWVFYLAVMSLWRAKREGLIGRYALVPGYATLVVGAVLDCLVNLTLMSLLFWDRPRELLLTARLKRLIRTGGWRGKLAYWVCRHLLNPFDPTNNHCD